VWQDVFAHGARVGAPPDEFNAAGQDWGVPPFVPWKLRAAGYEPLVRTMRAAMRHAGALRVDHVMGLFRLYWIPPGLGPADGAYVRYPESELLEIVALESVRAGVVIVGEDLGTVEDDARARLAAAGVLSSRLVWFEREPPAHYPEQAFAAVTTHDLPTIPGAWTGADLDAQRAAGVEPNVAGLAELRAHLAAVAGVTEAAPVAEVVLGAYRRLASAPAMIVSATLDDPLGVEERPNLPGTTDERPNWSIALPVPLDSIERNPVVQAVAAALAARDARPDAALVPPKDGS
jgi:4-alpha-glucanotransferase